MRTKILLWSLALFLLVGVAFAKLDCTIRPSCLDTEKSLLQVSGTFNAHIAFDEPQTNKLCCVDKYEITAVTYNPGQTPAESAFFLSAGSRSSSHAYASEDGLYDTYLRSTGEADCVVSTSGAMMVNSSSSTNNNMGCPQFYSCVLSLKTLSDSHVAQCGYYSNSLCCKNCGIEEYCNNEDDNCNNEIDEGVQNTVLPTGNLCFDGREYPCDVAHNCQTSGTYTCMYGERPSSTSGPEWYWGDPEDIAELESCNGLDDNCNGFTDEGCDDDEDEYCDSSMAYDTTNIAAPLPVCTEGAGDCNDYDFNSNPGETEETFGDCSDLADNDCDGHNDRDDVACIEYFFCKPGGFYEPINGGPSCVSGQWCNVSVAEFTESCSYTTIEEDAGQERVYDLYHCASNDCTFVNDNTFIVLAEGQLGVPQPGDGFDIIAITTPASTSGPEVVLSVKTNEAAQCTFRVEETDIVALNTHDGLTHMLMAEFHTDGVHNVEYTCESNADGRTVTKEKQITIGTDTETGDTGTDNTPDGGAACEPPDFVIDVPQEGCPAYAPHLVTLPEGEQKCSCVESVPEEEEPPANNGQDTEEIIDATPDPGDNCANNICVQNEFITPEPIEQAIEDNQNDGGGSVIPPVDGACPDGFLLIGSSCVDMDIIVGTQDFTTIDIVYDVDPEQEGAIEAAYEDCLNNYLLCGVTAEGDVLGAGEYEIFVPVSPDAEGMQDAFEECAQIFAVCTVNEDHTAVIGTQPYEIFQADTVEEALAECLIFYNNCQIIEGTNDVIGKDPKQTFPINGGSAAALAEARTACEAIYQECVVSPDGTMIIGSGILESALPTEPVLPDSETPSQITHLICKAPGVNHLAKTCDSGEWCSLTSAERECAFSVTDEEAGVLSYVIYSCDETACTLESSNTLNAPGPGSVTCDEQGCTFSTEPLEEADTSDTTSDADELGGEEGATQNEQGGSDSLETQGSEDSTDALGTPELGTDSTNTAETPETNQNANTFGSEYNYGTAENPSNPSAPRTGEQAASQDSTAIFTDEEFSFEEEGSSAFGFVAAVIALVVTLSGYLAYNYYYKPRKPAVLPPFVPTPTQGKPPVAPSPSRKTQDILKTFSNTKTTLSKDRFKKELDQAFSGKPKELKKLEPVGKPKSAVAVPATREKKEDDPLTSLAKIKDKKKKKGKGDVFDDLEDV